MRTRIHLSGNNQILQIPENFHISSDMVDIIHGENGDIILRPVVSEQDEFLALFGGFDEAFIHALEDRDNTQPREHEPL